MDSSEPSEPAAIRDTGPAYQVLVAGPDHWEGLYHLTELKSVPFVAHRAGQQIYVWIGGESYVFSASAPSPQARGSREARSDEILCSIPGVILAVQVAEGDSVQSGQDLVIMESMKTEHVIKSPRDGTVQRVSVQPGDRVDRGMRLIVLHPVPGE